MDEQGYQKTIENVHNVYWAREERDGVIIWKKQKTIAIQRLIF